MGHDPILRQHRSRNPRSGQAIVMVVLSLFAMCGVLGLAVDFGWAYFVKRAAQAAADTAAIAAAEELRRMTGGTGPFPCLNGGVCRDDSTPYICAATVNLDSADNLDNGCLYARRGGFQEAANQRVRISEGTASAPPTLPGVTMQYWATVRVTETVPQLFAAMTGNPIATVSARATGGVYQGEVRGSIILLNRENDTPAWGGGNSIGTNIEVGGGSTVTAGGGIFMASDCHGSNCNSNFAGELSGGGTVTAPYTLIRGTTDVHTSLGGSSTWVATPQVGLGEGSEFQDPTRKKTQLPISDLNLEDCYIEGGLIEPLNTGGTVQLGPGNYYATKIDGNGNQVPTGQPIKVMGNINFNASGSCLGGRSDSTGFGTYVIYGGIVTKSGNANTNLTFEPGAIVMAGVAPKSNGDANALFDMSVGGSGFSLTGAGSSSAGNVFVFTDTRYPGLSHAPTRLATSGAYATFKQGESGFKSGNNQSVSFSLDGLNEASGNLPPHLKDHNSVVMWQDRRNSSVLYEADGLINGNYGCDPYSSTLCTKSNQSDLDRTGVVNGSPGFFIDAGANTVIRGTIYQPRGAWATLQGSTGMTAALQLVTGALRLQGGNSINLQPVTSALPISIVGLVE